MPRPGDSRNFPEDPLWFRDAVIYELHVRAFHDSNDDGMGDFTGLTSKLDYLRDLGVNTLWLLPFYPSPWKDDGYDIADYNGVHPAYGTPRDFRHFLREAHERNLRVIVELVMNHTSDQHPWFQRSRRAEPGTPWRDFYVWSDQPDRYADARVIFKDFEASNWSWDPVAKAYYWHRFYAHQPDLNFDNPLVREEMLKIVDYWFKMSVDGLRLDAIPYLFEREGTSCENLPETHAFLKQLRAHVDTHYRDRLLLAEANQWPEDAAAYFGDGDECHMAFHFPLMPRLFMAIRMEDNLPIIDTLEHTPAIPDNCQWALFLRNHDELTLEMVTDAERDYMYGAYARDPRARVNLGIRRRLAPLLDNNRRKIELMNTLLLSLPGTPVIYYGDEIGMGDNIYLGDRNAVRTPIQWSADRNAGFSRANPQQLFLPIIIDPEYHYESVNVEAQEKNPHSLLSWMKRLIAMRRRYAVFGRGSIRILQQDNRRVLVFLREYQGQSVMVVANLSRFVQYVQLHLSDMNGVTPIELFGGTRFPTIGELPYFLTLGPHGAYWFLLEQPRAAEIAEFPAAYQPPEIRVSTIWEEALHEPIRASLEAALPAYLNQAPWFSRKTQEIRFVRCADHVPVSRDGRRTCAVLLHIVYRQGEPESWLLPLAFASGERAATIQQSDPHAIVANVHITDLDARGILFDAAYDEDYAEILIDSIRRGKRVKGRAGTLIALATRSFRSALRVDDALPRPAPRKVTQRNASMVFGEKYLLKNLRRVQAGVNVEVEMARHLAERRDFTHVARIAGTVEYHRRNEPPITLALLHEYIPNEGDAWGYTLDAIGDYLDDVFGQVANIEDIAPPTDDPLALAELDVPSRVAILLGPYLEATRLLARRTAQMHLALSEADGDPAFEPEPFTDFHRRALSHAMDSALKHAFRTLRGRLSDLENADAARACYLLERENDVRAIVLALRDRAVRAKRIRCHGYYHLRQVLYTGNDFVIVDFEGEPRRRLGERRLKSSPLSDVAGMLRSYHFAAGSCLLSRGSHVAVGDEDVTWLQPAAFFWQSWISAAFLKSYMETLRDGGLLPEKREDFDLLLRTCLLDRALYELMYEVEQRPDWLRIPVEGIVRLIERNRK